MATPYETMLYIWDKIPKNPDNHTITYSDADLIYLYHEGFVNTRKFSMKDWKKAFVPYLGKDQKYTLNRNQFLAIRKYRYNGPSDEMFDCSRIREGAWTDAQLTVFYRRSVRQASEMPEEMFWKLINDLKKNGYSDENGNMIFDADIKKGLSYVVAQFPSPRTRLEYKVKTLREKGEEGLKALEQKKTKSQFSVGTTAVETTLASLQKLQSSAPKASQVDTTQTATQEEVDIKKLRKPKGKLFG
ncbi:MAG: hypothetical protein ACD_62C00241G0008 [uncultured bacterium]|nr:MAG: hypothetical protein ACD_62C00241G0008 [uncultured bacterium]HLD44640.1 hypothetical protein [bacterium]